jgi:hypothetical protein
MTSYDPYADLPGLPGFELSSESFQDGGRLPQGPGFRGDGRRWLR